MSLVLSSLICLILPQCIIKGVLSSRLSCAEDQLSGCTKRFQTYLDSGVDILKDANDTFIGQVCGQYFITSSCLTSYIYYCSDFRKREQDKVKLFEYACNTDDHSGSWPFMATVGPGEDTVDEALDALERSNLIDSAIKASIAAAVTVLLILVCVMAECISKWKVRQRVKKATSAAAAAQGEQPLLKNMDNEEAADGTKKE